MRGPSNPVGMFRGLYSKTPQHGVRINHKSSDRALLVGTVANRVAAFQTRREPMKTLLLLAALVGAAPSTDDALEATCRIRSVDGGTGSGCASRFVTTKYAFSRITTLQRIDKICKLSFGVMDIGRYLCRARLVGMLSTKSKIEIWRSSVCLYRCLAKTMYRR